MNMADTSNDAARDTLERFRRARHARGTWEAVWQDCYEFTLPQRAGGGRRNERLFDATAGDAAEQLAASLMSQLVPPWSRWFGLQPGGEVPEAQRPAVGQVLEKTAGILQAHFDRSNFAMEIHQCFLDLVVAGTAMLQFEEAPAGADSAFRFTAVPLARLALDETAEGNASRMPGCPTGSAVPTREMRPIGVTPSSRRCSPSGRDTGMSPCSTSPAMRRRPWCWPKAGSSSRPSLPSAGSRRPARSMAARPS